MNNDGKNHASFSLIPSGKGNLAGLMPQVPHPSAVIFALLHSGSEVWGRENLTHEERAEGVEG